MGLGTYARQGRSLTVVAALAIGVVTPLAAQQPLPQLAERVRVTLVPDSSGAVLQPIGTVRAMRGDTLFLTPQEGSVLAVPFARIAGLERSAQYRSRTSLVSRYVNTGLVVGGVLGAASGISVGAAGSSKPSGLLTFLGILVGGAVGMPVGAAVGYGMAGGAATDTWVELAIPPSGSLLGAPPVVTSPVATSMAADERRALLAERVPVGMRVAVFRVSDHPNLTGTVLAADAALTVRDADGMSVAVPWSDVRMLRQSVGRASTPETFTKGALLGALGGAFVAWAASSCSPGNCGGSNPALITGGAIGAGVGGAIALGRREEQWKTIVLPEGLTNGASAPTP